MELIDLGLIILCALSALKGFYKGLLYEFIKLLSLVSTLTISLAIIYFNPAIFAQQTAYIKLLFICIMMFALQPFFWSAVNIINLQINSSILYNINRALGLVFGLLQVLILILVIETQLSTYVPDQNILKDSMIIGHIKQCKKPIMKLQQKFNLTQVSKQLDKLTKCINISDIISSQT